MDTVSNNRPAETRAIQTAPRLMRQSQTQTHSLRTARTPDGPERLPQMQRKSADTEAPSLVSRVREQAAIGSRAAAADRENGVGLREGLRSFARSQAAREFVEAAISIIKERVESRTTGQTASKPRTAVEQSVEQFGQRAQNRLLKDSEKQVLAYIAQQWGGSLKGTTAGQILDGLLGSGVVGGQAGAGAAASTGTAAATAGAAAEASAGAASTASAGSAAAGAAAEAGAGSSTVSTMAGTASRAMGAAGAAYSLYDIVSSWGKSTPQRGAMNGAAVGAYAGSFFGPVGTGVGMAIGAVAGGLIGMIKGGKSTEQLLRDGMRDQLQKADFIDEKYGLLLADGSTYDIGLDGGHRYPNADGTERRPFEVDLNDPSSPEVTSWAQPLGAILTGMHPQLKHDLTGYFVNAAQSNASDLETMRRNVLTFYHGAGLDLETSAEFVGQLVENGKLNADEAAIYINALGTVFDEDPPAQQALRSQLSGPVTTEETVDEPAPFEAENERQQVSEAA